MARCVPLRVRFGVPASFAVLDILICDTYRENHLSFRSSTGTVLYLVYYPPFLSFSIPKFSLKGLGLSFVTTEQDVTGQFRA